MEEIRREEADKVATAAAAAAAIPSAVDAKINAGSLTAELLASPVVTEVSTSNRKRRRNTPQVDYVALNAAMNAATAMQKALGKE